MQPHEPHLRIFPIVSAVSISVFCGGSTYAEPVKAASAPTFALGAPFIDHAVLQQGMPLPVWGTAPQGTKVTVEFAGQVGSAVADSEHQWRATLDPLDADKLVSVNGPIDGPFIQPQAIAEDAVLMGIPL